jgi:hypothetical protein
MTAIDLIQQSINKMDEPVAESDASTLHPNNLFMQPMSQLTPGSINMTHHDAKSSGGIPSQGMDTEMCEADGGAEYRSDEANGGVENDQQSAATSDNGEDGSSDESHDVEDLCSTESIGSSDRSEPESIAGRREQRQRHAKTNAIMNLNSRSAHITIKRVNNEGEMESSSISHEQSRDLSDSKPSPIEQNNAQTAKALQTQEDESEGAG